MLSRQSLLNFDYVELGKQMLSESGLDLISADDMNDGAIKAINSIGGNA